MNWEQCFIKRRDEKLICTLLQARRMVVPLSLCPGLCELFPGAQTANPVQAESVKSQPEEAPNALLCVQF